jgi:hypothetical protein
MRKHCVRRIARYLIAAVCLAAVLGGAPLATAATSARSGPHDTSGTEILHVVARQTQSATLHLGTGKKGPSLGDEYIYAEDLYIHGKKLGDHGVVCSYVHVTPDTLQCLGTFSLPEGQISGQALLHLPATTTVDIAITGGTGAYSTARGFVHTVAAGTTERQLTFHIIR